MNWKNIDLNLLIVFDALMSERNVTRAGQKMGLSQPAVSAALAKLRQSFKDDLFIRESGGIRPTPRALELSLKFKTILGDIETALSNETTFNPKSKKMSLKIEMDPYTQLIFLTPFFTFMRKEAPLIDLHLKSSWDESALATSQKFQTDLIFSIETMDNQRMKTTQIVVDDYVVCAHKDFNATKFTLQDLARLPHIHVMGLTPSRSEIDRVLEGSNLYRNVRFKLASVKTAFALLEQGEHLCILPRRVVNTFAGKSKIKVFNMPLQIAPLRLKMGCMPTFTDSALHCWLEKSFPKIKF